MSLFLKTNTPFQIYLLQKANPDFLGEIESLQQLYKHIVYIWNDTNPTHLWMKVGGVSVYFIRLG